MSFTSAPRKLQTNPLRLILILYCNYFYLAFRTQIPACFVHSRVREPLPYPTYLHRSHFSIYGPAIQIESFDSQNGRISKLSNTPLQFKSVFHIDNRFWRGALVNVQL
ncbi:hypothetical protein AVEN_209255-1 [Araneus ventricosus]|uniref:Uncharacterized protein n=1 Tax=Araneus ventricosus TaxID=182803 RepID=A0A4Y2SAE3_ARAVE|nr:hypothetical protein AVEN_209255-1 [Araneus ventricosus]